MKGDNNLIYIYSLLVQVILCLPDDVHRDHNTCHNSNINDNSSAIILFAVNYKGR